MRKLSGVFAALRTRADRSVIHIDGRLTVWVSHFGFSASATSSFNPELQLAPSAGCVTTPQGRPSVARRPAAFALGFVPLEGFICCFDVLSDSIAELHPVFVILVPSGDVYSSTADWPACCASWAARAAMPVDWARMTNSSPDRW